MKLIKCTFFALFFCVSLFASSKHDSLILTKNTLRIEVGAKSPVFGFLYDRELTHKKWSSYLSLGMGVGLEAIPDKSNPYPTMFNASYYFKFNRWKIKPILGFGVFTWLNYDPYPATLADRNLLRKGLAFVGGPPLSPPFTFIGTTIAGAEIKLCSRWSFQLLYTQYFLFDFIISEYQGSLPFGGINFGYTL